MNKKSIVKKILFYLGILCVVLLGGCCIQILHNPLSGIPQESEDIPVYLENNVLHIGKEKRYIRDLRMYALCLYDDRIYTVYTDYTEDDKFDWYLVSIDIHTKEQKVHSVLKDMDFDYLSYEFRKKYKERNMYYLDGEIVLNDMKQV